MTPTRAERQAAEPTSFAQRLAQAWRLRVIDPKALVAHRALLRATTTADGANGANGANGADSAQAGWACVFEAWGQLASGDRSRAESLLALARPMLAHDATGRVVCDGVQADFWNRDRQFDKTIHCCQQALALPR